MDKEGPEWDSHNYWKMKVLSMHKNTSSDRSGLWRPGFIAPLNLSHF